MSEVLEQVRTSRLLEWVENPASYFEQEKRKIWDKIGDLYDIRIPFNRILIAIWTPEKDAAKKNFKGGGSLIIPDQITDENKWQGKAGLVVKMGPHCYEPNDEIEWYEDDKCQVGDWVQFRVGEGFKLEVWKHECVMLDSERAIKAVLDRPDSVF